MDGSQPLARGELHPTRTLHREALRPCASLRHPLILDGFSSAVAFRLRQTSACTFYLVFKEPGMLRRSAEAGRSLRVFLLQGNLPILLEDSKSCQPLAGLIFRSPTTSQHSVSAGWPPETAGGLRSLKDFLGGKKICSMT